MKEAVRELVVNDIGIEYEIKDDKVATISVRCEDGEWIEINDPTNLKEKKQLSKLSTIQLRNIEKYMKAANVLGIRAYNDEQKLSLTFSKWGLKKFDYVFYFSKDAAERDKCTFGDSKSHIMFNDSVTFVKYGIYPGGGEFCDYTQFQKSIGSEAEKSGGLNQAR